MKLRTFGLFALALTRCWKQDSVQKSSLSKMTCIVFAFCVVVAITAPAQITTLVNFDGTNGQYPQTPLVQGVDGNFYGTTNEGGAIANASGTVFKMTAAGELTTLYTFNDIYPTDGNPIAGLALGSDGNFYGIGDAIFKITPSGTLTTLSYFDGVNGAETGSEGFNPNAGALIQGDDGNFYGTTEAGGVNGRGNVFKITADGELTTLYSFCAQAGCSDGSNPFAPLVQADDGSFYGTTFYGGVHGEGTVFRITPQGALTTLHSFNCGGGAGFPIGGLIQAADGNLYGTTSGGGYWINFNYTPSCPYGTVFKITKGGKLTTLVGFFGDDGESPVASLFQGTDGNFYGTSYGEYSTNTIGTVFQITSAGALSTLLKFDYSNGCYPGGLIQATDGNFYGTTYGCGANGGGTIFSLPMGLGPFVTFLQASRTVGQTVQILGQGFTGATSVSFNGTAATFIVESDTYLKATVPAGATTGNITVAEPSGTLTSNKIFRVLPQISGISPTSGPVGTPVVITGNSLTGATIVTFDCKWQASFTVDSDTQITAIVPANATVGTITVRTPGGTYESTQAFTVTP